MRWSIHGPADACARLLPGPAAARTGEPLKRLRNRPQRKGPAVRGLVRRYTASADQPACLSSHASISDRRSWRIIMRYLMLAMTWSATRLEVGAMYYCA